MFKKITEYFKKFITKNIYVVFLKGKFERHGNCIDIAQPSKFTPIPGEGSIVYLPLGFKATLPKWYRGVVFLRSSAAKRYGVSCPNGHGEIEWDYSNEWKGIIKIDEHTQSIPKGARVFQFYIEPVWDAPWYIKVAHLFAKFNVVEVESLNTDREGLGSSGI